MRAVGADGTGWPATGEMSHTGDRSRQVPSSHARGVGELALQKKISHGVFLPVEGLNFSLAKAGAGESTKPPDISRAGRHKPRLERRDSMRMEILGKRPDLLAAFSRACRLGASCATSACRTIPNAPVD